MFTTSDLDRMHELLSGPKVKDGQLAGEPPCCKSNGIFLFPGEREYIADRFPEGAYELTFEADVSDLFKIAGMQWVYRCKECKPEAQPLGCRLYPTLAYIEQWAYRGLILDKDYFYAGPCDLCEHPERLDDSFLRNAFGVWAWVSTDPKVASILARIGGHARQSGIDRYCFVDDQDAVVWRAVGSG